MLYEDYRMFWRKSRKGRKEGRSLVKHQTASVSPMRVRSNGPGWPSVHLSWGRVRRFQSSLSAV